VRLRWLGCWWWMDFGSPLEWRLFVTVGAVRQLKYRRLLHFDSAAVISIPSLYTSFGVPQSRRIISVPSCLYIQSDNRNGYIRRRQYPRNVRRSASAIIAFVNIDTSRYGSSEVGIRSSPSGTRNARSLFAVTG